MLFPVSIQDLENFISTEKFTKEIYNSSDFDIAKICFSLLGTLEDIIIDSEKYPDRLIVVTRNNWFQFISTYYDRFNSCKNILKTLLKAEPITSIDRDILKENSQWIIDLSMSMFKENDPDSLVFAQVIFAGKFYNAFYYYFLTIESYCFKNLDLVEKYYETAKRITEIIEEREWIEGLQEEILELETEDDNLTISSEIHSKLIKMWSRTIQFVEGELISKLLPETFVDTTK